MSVDEHLRGVNGLEFEVHGHRMGLVFPWFRSTCRNLETTQTSCDRPITECVNDLSLGTVH